MKTSTQIQAFRIAVSLALGMMAGLAIMNLLYGEKLDALYLERNNLYYRNNEKFKKIQMLEKDLDKRNDNQYIGQDISVEVQLPENESRFYQDQLRQEVQELMQPFVGKSVHWISDHPEVLDSMLGKRIIQLEGDQTGTHTPKVFHLKLKYLTFVGSKLKIWVIAQEKTGKEKE
ncbi:hypothetical protein [Melghirimyces algeriensis]|uniref:Uncharacterized protein n=1 Tax=Melghirimyces algeriensis TaxID=910412 RepID=A0A521AEL8_9BACL|nr:hypothetical protein [Melghirimyces algeriensis]SMO33253.1 hypothetical protein SAMN06264849_10196 [Melghirimyces algeriensis]